MPKISNIIISTLLLFNSLTLSAQISSELNRLENWEAGTTISEEAITIYGIENCFEILEIDDAIFNRIYQKSFKTSCTTARSDLRYIKLLHRNAKAQRLIGEIICHKSISSDLVEIFRILYDNCYPIQRVVLIDNYEADDNKSMENNNSSAFNFRYISGTKKLSNHSLGLAIDINPLQNPYVKLGSNGTTTTEPKSGRKYTNRELNEPYMITKGDLCYTEFTKRGFTWGGNWKNSKDYQHFEKKI